MSFTFSFSVEYLARTGVHQPDVIDTNSDQLATSNTSKIIEVTLYPRWYKHVVVEWKIPIEWGNCLFNVYFGRTSVGPFKRINSIPINGNHLRDEDTKEYSKFEKGYYVIEAILLDHNNATLRSEAETWDTVQNPWVQLRSQEIQRRELLLLRKFTGTKAYLFRRMTYGERCPECWNESVGKAMKDNCKTCLGTSFKGGYFPCYTTYMDFDASPNSKIKTYFGTFEPNQVPAWTISIPEVFPDDIVIRYGEWDLYKVDNTSHTELQGKMVRQMLQLTELSKKSIEYELLTKNIPEFPAEYT